VLDEGVESSELHEQCARRPVGALHARAAGAAPLLDLARDPPLGPARGPDGGRSIA